MLFDYETGWIWINGIGKVRLTTRERQVLRDLIEERNVDPDGWDENANLRQYVMRLRQKGINIKAQSGYKLVDQIEMIGG